VSQHSRVTKLHSNDSLPMHVGFLWRMLLSNQSCFANQSRILLLCGKHSDQQPQ